MLISGPTSQVLEPWLLEAVRDLKLVGLLRDRRRWWKVGSCSELAEAFSFFLFVVCAKQLVSHHLAGAVVRVS